MLPQKELLKNSINVVLKRDKIQYFFKIRTRASYLENIMPNI